MLNSRTLALLQAPFPPIDAVGPIPMNSWLECYLEGWAKADVATIRLAVTSGYRGRTAISRQVIQNEFSIFCSAKPRGSSSATVSRRPP